MKFFWEKIVECESSKLYVVINYLSFWVINTHSIKIIDNKVYYIIYSPDIYNYSRIVIALTSGGYDCIDFVIEGNPPETFNGNGINDYSKRSEGKFVAFTFIPLYINEYMPKKMLYFICNSGNLSNIKQHGIVNDNDDKIWFFKNKPSLIENSPDDILISFLRIDNDVVFYEDPNYPDKVFTSQSISPKYLIINDK